MDKDKSGIIEKIAQKIAADEKEVARKIILEEYPHEVVEIEKRTYTMTEKMEQFLVDGFVDRYTGNRLLNPGILKIMSVYFPDEFPFHPHWKMTETHIAYWELIPTIDHIYPIAKGGHDNKDNWVTTSMKNNSIKSNYTIEEINWKLYPKGNLKEWDGLTGLFIELVDGNKELLEDNYIKSWYNVSKKLNSCVDMKGQR